MLSWTTHDTGGILVVTVEHAPDGSDDRQAAHRQALYDTIQNRPDGRFAIDLGRIDFMSSADIGFLISVRRRAGARNGQIVLFDVNPYIRDSLATMKLLSLFPIADDLTGAMLLLPSGG